ncbi:MAG: hypothetical protein RLY86_123 [Pseudomonadota bacterium]|jgi:hypothetical protein
MTSLTWSPVLTDAGRNAITAADGLGLSARIVAVGLGAGRYAVRLADQSPTAAALEATTLEAERLRVPVLSGGSPQPGSLLLVAEVPAATDPADEFHLSEIGFFDQDGTLLVVWSDPVTSLGYRGALGAWTLQLAWSWVDMPADAVTVQVASEPLSEQVLRVAQQGAQLERLAQESGVTYSPGDATVVARAVDAKVAAVVASLTAAVRRPIGVSPGPGEAGVLMAPTLVGNSYWSADGYVHSASQFQIIDLDGATVHDSGQRPPGTSYAVPPGLLAPATSYRWQVRYQGTLGQVSAWSDWSPAVTFETGSVQVVRPSILSPTQGQNGVAAVPTLTSSAFAVSGGTDAHSRSQWQIATSAAFAAPVWDSGQVTALTQVSPPDGTLQPATTYWVRVRHIGGLLGPSEWSPAVSFTTRSTFQFVNTPTITAPAAGSQAVSLTPTITLSPFSVTGGADTHQATQVQVRLASGSWAAPHYDSGDLAAVQSHTVPIASALPANVDVVFRARYRGAVTGWSAWSPEVASRTVAAPSGTAEWGLPGLHQWVVPAGVTQIMAECIGGGGSSVSGLSRGAGGGGYVRGTVPVTPGSVLMITVGGPAPVGTVGVLEGQGGTSSVGAHLSATGGRSPSHQSLWAPGGEGIGGTVRERGGDGGTGGGGAGGPIGPGSRGRSLEHDGPDVANESGGAGGGGPAGRGGNRYGPGSIYGGGAGGDSDTEPGSPRPGGNGFVRLTW